MNLINALAVIGIFFLPVVMVIMFVWFKSNEKRKRYQLQAEMYSKALEKGQSVPADLFDDIKKKRNPLNTGIICIATGIGITLFLWLSKGAFHSGHSSIEFSRAAALGIIPFLIGVAYVLIHFIEKKQAVNENAK